jgi:PhzF family phenazine biosynthesis protein
MLGCTVADIAITPFEIVSTGVPWLIVELSQFRAISALKPNFAFIDQECKNLQAAGLTVFAERRAGEGARIRVRTFAPGEGVLEDPVCGSGNGSVTAYLARHKHPDDEYGNYLAEQGVEMGRSGHVHASWTRHSGTLQIRIGGGAAMFASGQLYI